MYMAFQNVHAPIQAPEKYIEKYEFIKDKTRRVHAAMADILDEAVGNITDAFKKAGLVAENEKMKVPLKMSIHRRAIVRSKE